ncbi:hypothetical protein [Acrocarpospora sp. B8E8]
MLRYRSIKRLPYALLSMMITVLLVVTSTPAQAIPLLPVPLDPPAETVSD